MPGEIPAGARDTARNRLGTNGDGRVSVNEFKEGNSSITSGTSPKITGEIIDTNKDGFLSRVID